MHFLKSLALLVLLAAIGGGAFVWSGWYDVGADVPHARPVYAVLEALRDRSIARRARDIAVPGHLGDEDVILKGAGQYAAMCTGCHLAPGMRDSEIRPGLYPRPPDLSRTAVEPRAAFWAIKHGIKMSAMPAWGSSHDDATIWSMVAFLRKLPSLTPAEYRAIVAKAPPDDDMDGDDGHAHAAHGADASDASMPGMDMPAHAATTAASIKRAGS